MDMEFLAKHDWAISQSEDDALMYVNKMELPKIVDISPDAFKGLGARITEQACQNLQHLHETHGDKLPYLFAISLREQWLSLYYCWRYHDLMHDESDMGNYDYARILTSAESYGKDNGVASILYSRLTEALLVDQSVEFLEGTPFTELPLVDDLLRSAAINYFVAAASACRADNIQVAFEWLGEAYLALMLAEEDYMWDEGAKHGREQANTDAGDAIRAARSKLAKAGALARHSGNRSDKSSVFQWCEENMHRFQSMDEAALDIAETFVPQKFRAVREWMTEWKKLRSASTP